MAEYFDDKHEAEKFIKEWYTKDGAPVFFGKILNHGVEKWVVNYDRRQHPGASPYIKILEDCSHEIKQILTAIQPQQHLSQPQENVRLIEEEEKQHLEAEVKWLAEEHKQQQGEKAEQCKTLTSDEKEERTRAQEDLANLSDEEFLLTIEDIKRGYEGYSPIFSSVANDELARRGGAEAIQRRIAERPGEEETEERKKAIELGRARSREMTIEKTWLDKKFSGSEWGLGTIIIMLLFCTPLITITLALVGILGCKHPQAKRNAKNLLLATLGVIVVGIIAAFLRALGS